MGEPKVHTVDRKRAHFFLSVAIIPDTDIVAGEIDSQTISLDDSGTTNPLDLIFAIEKGMTHNLKLSLWSPLYNALQYYIPITV